MAGAGRSPGTDDGRRGSGGDRGASSGGGRGSGGDRGASSGGGRRSGDGSRVAGGVGSFVQPPPETTELGIDIIRVSRIAASLARFGDRFTKRVLTPAEAAYVRNRP